MVRYKKDNDIKGMEDPEHEMKKHEGEHPGSGAHWIAFASKEEKDLLHEELNLFGEGDEVWRSLIEKNNANIYIFNKGNFKRVHLLFRKYKQQFKHLMGHPGLVDFGLFLGISKDGQFNVSIEGASEIVRSGSCSRNYVVLSESGEKSFLYGNDVKKKDVKGLPRKGITHDRGICLILNANKDCLGVGKLQVDDSHLKDPDEDTIVLRNLVDKGLYLRKGL
ncbi:MAG: hypothetical protein ACTSXU_18070 [Promethearchaeota archaeon]